MLRVVTLIGLSQLIAGAATASSRWCVPEIDASATVSVLALLAGTGVLAYTKFKN
jgi:hypothetical protein